MAQTVNVNFRMDSDLKKDMERVCDDIGMSLSTAFTIFAKKVTRENGITFQLMADPFYGSENMSILENRVRDIKSGKTVLKEHDLIEVDE